MDYLQNLIDESDGNDQEYWKHDITQFGQYVISEITTNDGLIGYHVQCHNEVFFVLGNDIQLKDISRYTNELHNKGFQVEVINSVATFINFIINMKNELNPIFVFFCQCKIGFSI